MRRVQKAVLNHSLGFWEGRQRPGSLASLYKDRLLEHRHLRSDFCQLVEPGNVLIIESVAAVG